MNSGSIQTPDLKTTTDISTLLGKPHKVVLFNDEHHSFEEVVIHVQRSVKCDLNKAYSITIEAHNNGKAIAYQGNLETCEMVESRLAGPPLRLCTEIQAG